MGFSISNSLLAVSRAQAGEGSLGGVETTYTAKMAQLSQRPELKAQSLIRASATASIAIQAFSTAGNDLYMGVGQHEIIQAPLEKVDALVAAINDYLELFPSFKTIRIKSQEGDRLLTFWEQRIPLFFVPNVKYEMIYLFQRQAPDLKIFHYQLKSAGDLKASDGFIRLDRLEGSKTLYTEIDFFDADWGPASIVGKDKLWSDSLEGMAQSDLAMKFKAEHVDWNTKKIRSESEKAAGELPFKEILKNRVSLESVYP